MVPISSKNIAYSVSCPGSIKNSECLLLLVNVQCLSTLANITWLALLYYFLSRLFFHFTILQPLLQHYPKLLACLSKLLVLLVS